MKCNKHPGYQAKRRPLSNCQNCWTIYIDTVEKKSYKQGIKDVMNLLDDLKNKISECLIIHGNITGYITMDYDK